MDSYLAGDRYNPPKKKKEREESRPEVQPDYQGPFTILMTKDAQEGYEDLPGNVKTAMDEIMARLRAWPNVSGARTMFGKGFAPNKYRMKTWDWRIEFTVDKKKGEVTILRVGHRETFYDEYH